MSSDNPSVAIADRVSGLIGDLYTAAAEGAGWAGIAPTIADALGSTSAVLKLHGPGDAVHLLECTENLHVSDHQQAWAAHWHRHDLWVERSAAFGMSRVVTDQDLVTRKEELHSGFYQEWLRTMDIHHMVGAVFPCAADSLGVLGIHRPKEAGAYSDDDRRQVAFLLPHLQRALWLGQKMSAVATRQLAAEEVLERIDAAVYVVDRNRRIVTLNALGERQLHETNDLVTRHDRLILTNALLNAQLVRLVNAAISTASGHAQAASSAMVLRRDGRLPQTLLVTPMASNGVPGVARPLALVVVRDPEDAAFAMSALRELFGFTRTEAAIASSLARGLSVDRIAGQHGIGTATVRSHLKHILSKTGTHRLAEAVALISRSVAGFGRS